MRLTLEQCRPQGDDNVAQLLWEMLHLPDQQACQEVQVAPLPHSHDQVVPFSQAPVSMFVACLLCLSSGLSNPDLVRAAS